MRYFAGDDASGLVRLSPLIAEAAHVSGLVCHQDARHNAAVRPAPTALMPLPKTCP